MGGVSHRQPSLALAAEVRRAVAAHAEEVYPDECCGVLLGRRSDRRIGVLEGVRTANRAPAERRRRRFAIDPEEILAATRAARERGLEIVGYYHSHPDESARPSRRDLEAAWPATSYLIASVRAGRLAEMRSWLLSAGRSQLVEQPFESAPPAAETTT